jgi:hypothetical protein
MQYFASPNYKLISEIKQSSQEHLQYFVACANQSFSTRIPLVEQIKLLKHIIDREIASAQFAAEHPEIQQPFMSLDECDYYQLHIRDVESKLTLAYSDDTNEQITDAIVIITDLLTVAGILPLSARISEILTEYMNLRFS